MDDDAWDQALRRLAEEQGTLGDLGSAGVGWVTLAEAEAETGASRSALRAWFRTGEIPSRMVEGPNGPQRVVPLAAVAERAAASNRIRRRAEREVALEAEVALLRAELTRLARRVEALEAGGDGRG